MPQVGDRFLGFELVGKLGRGSFAQVFLARQPDLADRPVVLKVSADSRAESRALAQLQHPNIVPIHSVHQSGRLSALCMPYLGSMTLADVYRERNSLAPVPRAPSGETGSPARRIIERFGYTEAVLALAVQLVDGLAHAHERGILHRDLKPANILLTDEGVPILFDFNLATETRLRGSTVAPAGGTLPYMAPEQLRTFAGQPTPIDARSDLYAVGVILFELLTRSHPFAVYRPVARNTVPRMLSDRQCPPPRLRPGNPHVTPAVESIVRKCLAPDPQDRYQSARDLKEDLDRQLRHLPLRHAVDPSARERFWKWRRRHPSLATRTAYWILAAAAAVALILGHAHLEKERARPEPAASANSHP
jgi:serine/threonine protein kinase